MQVLWTRVLGALQQGRAFDDTPGFNAVIITEIRLPKLIFLTISL